MFSINHTSLNQSLRCVHEESLGPSLSIDRTAKTLIRLGGCPGWSVASMDAQSFCWFCRAASQKKKKKKGGKWILLVWSAEWWKTAMLKGSAIFALIMNSFEVSNWFSSNFISKLMYFNALCHHRVVEPAQDKTNKRPICRACTPSEDAN